MKATNMKEIQQGNLLGPPQLVGLNNVVLASSFLLLVSFFFSTSQAPVSAIGLSKTVAISFVCVTAAENATFLWKLQL